ncbi:MAG: FGGY-family carbohydrate kinase [Pseudomonadota bacterium]
MNFTLGIDIGTSGVRTAILEPSRAVLSMARAAHLPQDPEKIDATKWWGAVQACLHAQMAHLKDLGFSGQDISGISVDGTSGSMVLCDEALTPVSPALMYNSKGFDAEAELIARACPSADHITLGSNSALGRAMRLTKLATSQPKFLLHQADYILAKLQGVAGVCDHNNALKTGFDPEMADWPSWIASVIDPTLLPDVVPVGTELGTLSPQIAQAFGLNPNAKVYAGTTDSIAAFLAAAPMSLGAAVTSIGSTLAVKVLSDTRIDVPAQGLYSHKVGEYWLVGGASNTGGAVLAKFFSGDELEALSAQIDPMMPMDLGYYPLLQPGERFPINDPHKAPVLEPRPNSNAEFLQGLFEGIARIEAQAYALIEREGGPKPASLTTAGGAARNQVFTQIRERHLGLTCSQADETEAAVGAAKIPLMGSPL